MSTLQDAPDHIRASTARGASSIDREGGMFGAGLISGVSVIARGEALGHEMWVDADFISDVTAAINESKAEHGGVKARFTHPGLSSDGLASRLGRVVNARTEGERSIADLHLLDAAHRTPDGNLAEHILTLAEEDPESFGISIVFAHDLEAEQEQTAEHTENGYFVSPDEDNKSNYRHARLAKLRAADVVDDPAANPDGLFQQRQEVAADAEQVLSYALGLSNDKPAATFFDIDADRISGFVTRFLERHQLTVGKTMETETEVDEVQEDALTRESFASELNSYVEAFGSERGVEWFGASLDLKTAQTVFESMQAAQEALSARVVELEETLSSLSTGEEEPADFQVDSVTPARTFADHTRRKNSDN